MDIARYSKLKKKGNVSMMPAGKKGHFAVAIAQYDPDTREELDPEIVRVTRESVEAAKKAYQEGIVSCDTLLADMDALARTDAAPSASK